MGSKVLKILFAMSVCFVWLFLASNALARKIYLNNVEITGVKNQVFKNVKVRVDAQGNIYITGAQYRVKTKVSEVAPAPTPSVPVRALVQPTPPPSSFSRPSKKYVLIVQRVRDRASGYSLEITVNGKLCRKVPITTMQDAFDVTPYLKKGNNKIEIEASKDDLNTTGHLKLMIVEGTMKGGKILIKAKSQILKYGRKSDETDNFKHIYKTYVP